MFLIFLLFGSLVSVAQLPGRLRNVGNTLRNAGGKTDSLKHRDKLEDSVTISFRYLDSSRSYKLDSTISDFTKRFPIPATNIYLGNDGLASESILFSPMMKAGFDPGFHAFDIYKWTPDKIRFFNTTRPYTELNYLIGSRSEQMIEILHTQNVKPNWNVSFNYRQINSPGFFRSQKTAHNNYLLTSWYNSNSKRYNNYFMVLSNNLQASENGGMLADEDLDNPDYKDRILINTHIGSTEAYSNNFFNTKITTGNRYHELTILMRQQYDLGQKDSIVTDSTVVPLFYPRLRFEHTFTYNKDSYEFLDGSADPEYYDLYYDQLGLNNQTSFSLKDKWNDVQNDVSIYQFPDAKNLQQFIKLGAAVQNLHGNFHTIPEAHSLSFYNVLAHAEYRNRTRNKKWEIEANGKFYLNGFNAGDYDAHLSLQRLIGKKLGYLQLGFENVNRSPSYLYNPNSSFYMDVEKRFNKENVTHFFGSYFNPELKLKLTGDYYLVSNYLYITEFYILQQESALFNLLQVSLQKKFRIGKKWNWYTDVYVQQKAGNVDLNVPLVFTRNRLALEGVYYKNLNISTGLEIRYNSPYKADGYSPVLGQFTYQDSLTISNRPDIRFYLNFRIKSFRLFFSAANLNTISTSNGFGFTSNNLAAPGYAYPGLQLRFGIYWSFVN